MNIFALDPCPVRAAQFLCDKHVVQMGREAVELLCIAHRRLDGTLRRGTHRLTGRPEWQWQLDDERETLLLGATNRFVNNHHAIWARATTENYFWLALHATAVFEEYYRRYGARRAVQHSYAALAEWLLYHLPDGLQGGARWAFRQGVHPDCYLAAPLGVRAHRLNYVRYKSRFARWEHGRTAPAWYGRLAAQEPSRHGGRSKREIIATLGDARMVWPPFAPAELARLLAH